MNQSSRYWCLNYINTFEPLLSRNGIAMYQIAVPASCYTCRFICTRIYPARPLFTLNRSPMLVGPSHPRTTPFDVAFSTLFSASAQNASLSLSLSISISSPLTDNSPLPLVTHIRIERRETTIAFASRTLPKAQKWKRSPPASLEGAKKASVPANDNVSPSFSICEPLRSAVTEVDHVCETQFRGILVFSLPSNEGSMMTRHHCARDDDACRLTDLINSAIRLNVYTLREIFLFISGT